MQELDSEVAGGGEDSQQTQPKTKNPIVRTGRPVNSCVPVSVERLDQDKDADNVDADQINTVRLVESEQSNRFVHTARGNRLRLQSVWIATCSCETSRKLPCSRTREEDRESSSSRSTSCRLATK